VRSGTVVCEQDRPPYRTWTRPAPHSRACGAGDSYTAGLTLALWEIDHISRHTGISNRRGPGAHKACIAVRLSGHISFPGAQGTGILGRSRQVGPAT